MAERKDPRMRHGHRTAAENAHDEVARHPISWPAPGEEWHAAARRWYESLAQSGQVVDYQQSDVELAWILADDLSRHLRFDGQPIGAAAVTAFLAGCRDLLATPAERRRQRLELARHGADQEKHRLAAVESISARRPG